MRAGQTAALVKDRAAAKDMAAFCRQLRELDATPDEVNWQLCACVTSCDHAELHLFRPPYFLASPTHHLNGWCTSECAQKLILKGSRTGLARRNPNAEMQAWEADALAHLMASVNLLSTAADSPQRQPAPPQAAEGAPLSSETTSDQVDSDREQSAESSSLQQFQESGPQGHSQSLPHSQAAVPGQGDALAAALRQRALADCPLPFAAEAAPTAATPARSRKPARRAPVNEHTPEVRPQL